MRFLVAFVLTLVFAISCSDKWQNHKLGKLAVIYLPAVPYGDDDGLWEAYGETGIYSVLLEKDPKSGPTLLDDLAAHLAYEGDFDAFTVRDIVHRGWQGTEFYWTSGGTDGWGRFIQIGEWLVTLKVEFEREQGAPVGAFRFLNSIEVGGAGQGPDQKAGPPFEPYSSSRFGYKSLHAGKPTVETVKNVAIVDSEMTRSVFGRRTYFTMAAEMVVAFPESASDEELEEAGNALVGPLAQSWKIEDAKVKPRRIDGGYEFEIDGGFGAMGRAKVLITTAGNLLYVRGIFAPSPLMNSAINRKWFSAFRF